MFHESARLRYASELWGPTRQQRKYDPMSRSRLSRTLGNVRAGDGSLFRGRGLIQLTGRGNYRRFNQWLQRNGIRVDVVREPQRVADPDLAPLVFGWFWSVERDLNAEADRGDTRAVVRRITRKINGGYNGLSDRIRLFVIAMREIRRLEIYQSDDAPIL